MTLLALLFGNTCGSVSLLGDVGKLMLENFEEVPWWIGARSGVGIQMLLLVFLVLPLCLLRDIRSVRRGIPLTATTGRNAHAVRPSLAITAPRMPMNLTAFLPCWPGSIADSWISARRSQCSWFSPSLLSSSRLPYLKGFLRSLAATYRFGSLR